MNHITIRQFSGSSQLENLPCLNDTCFELVYSASNWDDAKSDCNKRGGSLTLIEQKETHDFLKSFLFQNRFWSHFKMCPLPLWGFCK